MVPERAQISPVSPRGTSFQSSSMIRTWQPGTGSPTEPSLQAPDGLLETIADDSVRP